VRVLLFLLLALSSASAETLRIGPPESLPALPELVLRGENRGAAPALLLLRVDDRPGAPYHDRANVERLVPPGLFTLRLRLPLLTTPRGRAIDPAALRLAIADSRDPGMRLSRLAIEGAPALPPGVRGWSFAPEGAAPLSGMISVAPGAPGLAGINPRHVRRPGEDPILARGMVGVTRFATPLPPGDWNITLWTEDAGEWETLPAVLEQRIRLNGQDVVLFRRSQEEWAAQRYFAGREIEATESPWPALGGRRGGRVEAQIRLAPGEDLVVELAGHPQAATHLAALLAEPETEGRSTMEALRAARFAEAWPVLHRPAPLHSGSLSIAAPLETLAAPGSVVALRFTARGPTQRLIPQWHWEGGALPLRAHWGQWRWRRPAPETPGLVLSAAHLRADAASVPLAETLPREITALVTIPSGTPPGERRLRLLAGNAVAEARITILPIERPKPRQRVGVFLDVAPHLAPDQAARQSACDLDTLRDLGFDLIAPPLATPPDHAAMLSDLQAAARRFAPPLVAYAPLRRLEMQHGPREAAAQLVAAERAIAAAGLPQPVWVVADEPSGAGMAERVRAMAFALREAGSEASLAGHLNDPADTALLPLLQLVTVNPRYGADLGDIARLRAAGVQPFLYNMPRLRLAAGFYLWRIGAEGLLQWHARMPTADAFDPTDGREGDVQFLWPTPGLCAAPDLDGDLLELMAGQEDLRWLAWLEQAPGEAAAALRRRLRREIPTNWRDAMALSPDAASAWQNAITALARNLMR
jgi:hypothetical protein